MSLVFDAHSHCFPTMGSGPMFPPKCLTETQYHLRHVGEQFLRFGDRKPLPSPEVLLGEQDGVSWLPDLNFRIGSYGRAELTYEGDDYYFHYVPPTLAHSSCPADFIIVQMDYAGVDRAVLQHDRIYGRLDEYLADCVKKYPDRFVALAQVDGWEGGSDEQVERVRRQIEDLGHSGLYFSTGCFCHVDFRFGVNDPSLEPLWELMSRSSKPIHWYVANLRRPRLAHYLDEIDELCRWGSAHPDVPCVLTHGLENLRIDLTHPDRYKVPPGILKLISLPNWRIELMMHKMAFDYEFPPHDPHLPEIVRTLVNEVGAEKILWGSDMPSCENMVTYSQSKLVFETRCDFLTDEQRAGILGGNLEKLYPPRNS
jgi:predicted TIM-barrel fold metal-dependent hydrolase